MNDYFDNVGRVLGNAAHRRAHLPWYARIAWTRRTRAVVVVLAALVVATPAVAAVSGWFSVGKPYPAGVQTPRAGVGAVIAGSARILPLRVSDPAGGPNWGVRFVRTTRGDICLQLGRIEDGQIGSLGIDNIWHDDHEFHPFPSKAAPGYSCTTPDASGHGYVIADSYAENISAAPSFVNSSSGCLPQRGNGNPRIPLCPAGTSRMVFYGLLGPDVESIEYTTPSGETHTERTAGGVGAYLLIFRRTSLACLRYAGLPSRVSGACVGVGGASLLDGRGPITRVNYLDGKTCVPTRAACPYEGAAPYRLRPVSGDAVAAPIRLHFFPARVEVAPVQRCLLRAAGQRAGRADRGRRGDRCRKFSATTGTFVPVTFSVVARVAVTSSRSWYSWVLAAAHPSEVCGGHGMGMSTDRDLPAGSVLHYSVTLNPSCHSLYRIIVGYAQSGSSVYPRFSGVGNRLLFLARGKYSKHRLRGVVVVGERKFRVP